MKAEGYLVKTDFTFALKVIICSMKPNPQFPKGGYMLKLKTGKTMMVYKPNIPKDFLVPHMKGEAQKAGYLLLVEGFDDEAIQDLEGLL